MSKTDPETLGARLAYENGHLKKSNKALYTKARRMEENIRRHAEGECDCKNPRVCLMRLYRLIPTTPRPTWRERMLGVRR